MVFAEGNKTTRIEKEAEKYHTTRPSWDDYFMNIAMLVGSRSTCLRRKVGAVAVKEKHLLATGYNGAPRGIENCLERGKCIRTEQNIPSGTRHELCRGLHAEQNLIIQAAYHGTQLKDTKIYTTTFPCSLCTKMLINTGVTEIVYLVGYPDELTNELLSETDISLKQMDPPKIQTPQY